MKRMKLKTKLILGSLTMVILVMIVSTTAVSFLINKQNKRGSYDQLRKASNIIRNDLLYRQGKLLKNARQIATVDKMGTKISFLDDYKAQAASSMTTTIYKEIATAVYNIAMSGDLWGAGIYDRDGDLVTFVEHDYKKTFLGYCRYSPRPTTQYLHVADGEKIDKNKWQRANTPPLSCMKVKFEQAMPGEEKHTFKQIGKYVCLVSYVPVMAEAFDKKTRNFVNKQFGFAMVIQKLDTSYLNRIHSLTGIKTNVFTRDGFSVGDIKAYDKLQGHFEKQKGPWRLKKQRIFLNDLDLEGPGFFQSVLPLFDDSNRVGAISSLLSKDIVRSNTLQMIKLLGMVYLACILVILPLVFLFSNSLAKPMNRIINSLTDSADKVSGASGQVSSSSHQLAEGSSEQAASIEETSAALEQMSSMTKQNADNAQEANSLSIEGSSGLKKANLSMKALISSMGDISKASDNVAKIIKTIDEIAFQTNLLALNAAVEAARAGEAGAGFAVVADEVRNLALRSAEASKNTQNLITEIIQKIETGSNLVNETDDRYREVALSVQKIGELISEISAASEEQNQGIDQVSKAVNEMDKVTQKNAANAEESASASEELNAQAKQMQNIVKELVSIVGGNSARENGTKEAKKKTKKNDGPVPFKKLRAAREHKTVDLMPVEKRQSIPDKSILFCEQNDDFRDF